MAGSIAPNIITDGLIFYIDAANNRSYPGSGTSCLDLSGNSNNGTLINSPSFSNNFFTFNGSNYISCGNSSILQITVGSISAWFLTISPGSSYRSIITKQFAWGLFAQDNILVTYDWGNSAPRTTNINVADGQWKNVVLTFTQTVGNPSNNAIIYLNGVPVLTTTVRHTNQNENLEISRGGSGGGGQTQFLNGSVSSAMVYNRVLSQSEILQNYNATRSRFGIIS